MLLIKIHIRLSKGYNNPKSRIVIRRVIDILANKKLRGRGVFSDKK